MVVSGKKPFISPSGYSLSVLLTPSVCCYLVFVAVVGKTQCFGKKPCCLSVYRLHRVAANLVVVSICCISLIVGVVAIGLLLIGVVVVVDVTLFALAASTTVHY